MGKRGSTERFSNRVENYVRYRPGYPAEVLEVLQTDCGLTPEWVVADIASGTGMFARLLVENGNQVFGVEPNTKMREAGEEYLAEFPNFISVAGTAEATGLPDESVDLVTAAQAAHWFERDKAVPEFDRILKRGGWLALIWNKRLVDATPFLRDYEQLLLTYGTDYEIVRHERTSEESEKFFAGKTMRRKNFPSGQDFDYAGLEGRLLSSSYAPQEEQPGHREMLRELRRIFDAHQQSGRVRFEYQTQVFYGQKK
jgi:SAM-dependent methyltransferase